MRPLQCPRRPRGGRHRQGGFTLFETILVIGVLAMVSAGLMAIQPQVFKTQNAGRDEFIGFELIRACAERLLAVRRHIGYGSVTTSTCNGMGAGVSDFAANPTVTLADADGNSIATCDTASCTATIIVAKTAVPPATLTAVTLQLSPY